MAGSKEAREATVEDNNAEASESDDKKDTTAQKRQIPGNLPYTTSVGVFKRALEKIIESERPVNFNRDFMSTVLGISGGASNPIIPILKKLGLIGETGAPTALYADFQSTSSRAGAALQALRRGFAEIFKRNQYAHKADKDRLTDIIRTITGLPQGDSIVGYIYNTFATLQGYAKLAPDIKESDGDLRTEVPSEIAPSAPPSTTGTSSSPIALAYQINIVLPETTNVDVFNAIFKSLKDNLLR